MPCHAHAPCLGCSVCHSRCAVGVWMWACKGVVWSAVECVAAILNSLTFIPFGDQYRRRPPSPPYGTPNLNNGYKYLCPVLRTAYVSVAFSRSGICQPANHPTITTGHTENLRSSERDGENKRAPKKDEKRGLTQTLGSAGWHVGSIGTADKCL